MRLQVIGKRIERALDMSASWLWRDGVPPSRSIHARRCRVVGEEAHAHRFRRHGRRAETGAVGAAIV